MKKMTAALLLCGLWLAGCGASEVTPSEPPESTPPIQISKLDAIPFEGDQLYAIACLGYEKEERLAFYEQEYLDDGIAAAHYVSNGEYYLVIPRYPDMTLRLYRNVFGETEKILFYESETSESFLLQCNISDIFPDVTVEFICEGESVSFSPYISLKDGSLAAGERGLDLTRGT